MQTEAQVQGVLEAADLPYLESVEVSLRPDSTGDVAAYVQVVLADESAGMSELVEQAHVIEHRIRELYREKAIDYWPYTYFRGASEIRKSA